MPVFLSERLPLPSLRSYALLSVLLFACGLFVVRRKSNDDEEADIWGIIGKNSFCAWSAVNMAYCCLFLFGKIIQRFVFGDLKIIEEQHLQENFWNYVFYKFIFVFGVINAQTLTEVMCWLAWFSMVGFWKIFGQLCKDRFEFIFASPNALRMSHTKILCLLITILLSTFGMSIVAYHSGFADGWSIFLFMIAECILLALECLHIIAKYGVHLVDSTQNENWENKALFAYYIDLVFECITHGVDLLHHLHMLFWSNVFLSMASLVLYWNIRTIFSDLKKKLRKHQRYRKIIGSVQERFSSVDEEELSQLDDNCAICWDDMKRARKLPCGHIFHQSCLCAWLQQDTSCPTCRMSLAEMMDLPERNANHPIIDGDIDQRQFADLQAQGNQRNHFFHFDGTIIANWFPSFSIEVFHGGNNDDTPEHELEEMAVQVHTMFPALPYEVILEDIRQTHSPEATAENILEGNIDFNTENAEQEEIQSTEDEMTTQPDERPSLLELSDEGASESTRMVSESNSVAALESAGESSDTSSCAEFFDDSEKRQQSFSNRRQRLYADARRRFSNKEREQPSASNRDAPSQRSSHAAQKEDQEERRVRVLQAIQRRMRTEQQQ